jgi:hypothetical protein
VRVARVNERVTVHGRRDLRDNIDSLGSSFPKRRLRVSSPSGDSGIGALTSWSKRIKRVVNSGAGFGKRKKASLTPFVKELNIVISILEGCPEFRSDMPLSATNMWKRDDTVKTRVNILERTSRDIWFTDRKGDKSLRMREIPARAPLGCPVTCVQVVQIRKSPLKEWRDSVVLWW